MNEVDQRQSVRWNLRVVFLYYSSFGDRNNYKLLKTQNYRRFLIDSQAVKSHSDFPPFDIAFKKIHSTSINYEQFQQIIPNIAQLVFNHSKRKEAFNNFMKINMHRLYQQILGQSDFGLDILTIQKIIIEKKSLDLMQSIPLRKAYEKYIVSFSLHQKSMEQIFQYLYLFLNDFQISPKIICKVTTFVIFFYLNSIKKNKNKYEFQDLKKLIIYIAQLYWRKNQSAQGKQEEKIIRILHQMQLSSGFKRIVEKSLKQNGIVVSFFKKIAHRLLTQIQTQSKQKKGTSSRQKSSTPRRDRSRPQTTKSNNIPLFFSGKKRQNQNNMSNIKDILQTNQSQNVKVLKGVFDKLCSYGEVANTKTLKSIKIKKYFQNLNILTPLSQTWLDIKIVDLCRSSSSGKIQFPQFLQLLVLAASKLNITSDGLFQYIVNHSITQSKNVTNYNSQNSNKHKNNKQETQQRDNLFYHPYKAFQKLIFYYSQSKKQLTFDQLCKTLYDFQVFPSYISKSKLYTLFQKYSNGNQLKKLVTQPNLHLDGFIQLLYIIAMDIGQNLTSEEKSMFILQKMQDSHGYRTILGPHGISLIGDLRSRYINLYNNWNSKKPQIVKQKFEQLLQDYTN